MIRVPIALADKVLSCAHRLDAGWSEEDAGIKPHSLLQAVQKLEAVLDTPRNNFSRDKKKLLQSAIDDLKSLLPESQSE